MGTILSDKFHTKLGTIQTWLDSDLSDLVKVSENHSILVTSSHKVTLQKLTAFNDWLKPTINCESSMGWLWFIEKINNKDENLTLFCELINPRSDQKLDPNSGEWLDAVELETTTHHLHIGTEDGEIMRYRSSNNDFMPQRFEKLLGFDGTQYSFTEYTDFGFKTNIPKLFKDEKIYFHFLVATNPINTNTNNSNNLDISTWLAVDHHKSALDNYFDSDYSG